MNEFQERFWSTLCLQCRFKGIPINKKGIAKRCRYGGIRFFVLGQCVRCKKNISKLVKRDDYRKMVEYNKMRSSMYNSRSNDKVGGTKSNV